MANWIKKAIKHPRALTKKATSAGKSPMAFASAHKHDSGKTGQQARLAMTLRSMHGSGPFSEAEKKQGYKVCYTANDLNTMDVDRVENVPEEYRLAKRRESSNG